MGREAESRDGGCESALRRPLVGPTLWAWKVGQVGVGGPSRASQPGREWARNSNPSFSFRMQRRGFFLLALLALLALTSAVAKKKGDGWVGWARE